MWRKNRFFQSAPLAMPGVLFVLGIVLGDRMGTVGLWWLLLGVALVVVGIVVYVVLYNSRGAQAAKNAFTRIFWWICLVGTEILGIIIV